MYFFYFLQVEVGLLVSILVATQDTARLDEYLGSDNYSFLAGVESKDEEQKKIP